MVALTIGAAALVAGVASARTCTNMTVPVDITSRNAVFGNFKVPMDNLDATAFAQNITRQGGNATAQALTGYHTVSGRYNISAKYCKPDKPVAYGQKLKLQILTHGIGFDKTYWDLSFANYNYSYIANAVDKHGYATLSYDRLGIGNSSHGEPRDEIQSFLEIQALAAITRQLRNGSFPEVTDSFDKIVHVGHSFGSAQTYALTAAYPTISDGIVLTGFSMNASFVALFGAGNNFEQAYLNQPLRFGNASASTAIQSFLNVYGLSDLIQPIDPTTLTHLNYPPGYLTNANSGANQYLFFYPPYFNPQLLYVSENTKQPVTPGEALTLGSLPMMSSFKGPALVITGSADLPYCGGDCFATGGSAPSIPAAVAKNLPDASPFQAYIQPNTGHGINAHYNSTGAYDYVATFLGSHGL